MNETDVNIASLISSINVLLQENKALRQENINALKSLQVQNICAPVSGGELTNKIYSKSLNAAGLEFLSIRQTELRESSYKNSTEHRVRYATKFLGADKLVCDVTEDDARALINSKAGKDYERDHLRKVCNQMFEYFLDKKYTLSNPFKKIKRVKIQLGKISVIHSYHFEEILKFIKKNYSGEQSQFIIDVLIFLIETALRPNELLSIRKKYVLIDETKMQAALQIVSSKNYECRVVYVYGETYKSILRYYNKAKNYDDYLFPGRTLKSKQDHLKVDTISKIFKGACKKLNLPSDYHLYCLRATCASHLYTEGKDLQTISRLLGHSSVLVTQKYYARLLDIDDLQLQELLKNSKLNKTNKTMLNKLKRVV